VEVAIKDSESITASRYHRCWPSEWVGKADSSFWRKVWASEAVGSLKVAMVLEWICEAG